MSSSVFRIGKIEVPPGTRAMIDLPVTQLYTHSPVTMPVQVVCGKHPGPKLFVSAAVHGDEINGVEIIRRLLGLPALKNLRGVLVAVTVVNVHGFIHRSRYLPDRRDLNRSFPGSVKGSLAGRLANLFINEIMRKCTHGIDLHTAAIYRENLPQIRADVNDEATFALAKAFSVPVLLNANLRDGSLRQAAADLGIPTLLYEAGEALRFDELSIRAGVQGILSVMRSLEMLPPSRTKRTVREPVVSQSSVWVRAEQSGIVRTPTALGARVRKGDKLGSIADPFGVKEIDITASVDGIVVGRTTLPLANEGEALFHIAQVGQAKAAVKAVEQMQADAAVEPDPLLNNEPPIV